MQKTWKHNFKNFLGFQRYFSLVFGFSHFRKCAVSKTTSVCIHFVWLWFFFPPAMRTRHIFKWKLIFWITSCRWQSHRKSGSWRNGPVTTFRSLLDFLNRWLILIWDFIFCPPGFVCYLLKERVLKEKNRFLTLCYLLNYSH